MNNGKTIEERMNYIICSLLKQADEQKEFAETLQVCGDNLKAQYHDGISTGIYNVVNELEIICSDFEIE